MTKRELVIRVAEQHGYTQNEVADVIQTTLDSITEWLAEGNRIDRKSVV